MGCSRLSLCRSRARWLFWARGYWASLPCAGGGNKRELDAMTQRAPMATAGFFAQTCYRLESLRSCRVTIPSIVDDEIWAICSGEFGAPGRAYFGGRPWGASLLCSGKEAVVAS